MVLLVGSIDFAECQAARIGGGSTRPSRIITSCSKDTVPLPTIIRVIIG